MHPYPLLSFKELAHYLKIITPHLVDSRVERVFVPETKAHPEQFFKKEWVMDLATPSRTFQFYFSVRAQQCGAVLFQSKTFRPSSKATRSGFDLNLNKNLQGQKIISIEIIQNERAFKIHFHSFTLIFIFIPNQPEIIFLKEDEIIASTRLNRTFTLPTSRTLSEAQLNKIPYRETWIYSLENYATLWSKAQNTQALQLRKQTISHHLEHQLNSFQKKIKSLSEQLEQNKLEPDWSYFGNLLQIHFYTKPIIQKQNDHFFYELTDYEKNENIQIPADPKLSPKQQLEKYFHLAKRNKTREIESTGRINALVDKKTIVESALAKLLPMQTTAELETLEKELGLVAKSFSHSLKEQKKIVHFTGKQYQSKEGLTILAGKNLTENLELTFKIAKGNDLWFHVKGRPGSHTLILIPPGKSASLDSLLDAAHICILHSGGKEWGKTEVDYTFKKFVKKIKNQTEASYTHNKTLMVTLDPERMKRLFSLE